MRALSRRSFLLGAAPAAAAAVLPERRGAKVPSRAAQFRDALTERPLWRLTDPGVLHHLPHYHHRFISQRRNFLLVASELSGTRQIYRMNLPDGDMVQLTTGPGVHSYSPTLDPDDRTMFLLQENELKSVAVGNGREAVIYRSPRDWRMTGHLSVSQDGAYAALVEMLEQHWSGDAEKQFPRPHCRLRVVDLKTKRDRLAVDGRRWLTHPQFRPGTTDILYRHEGPADEVNDRLQLTSVDGKRKRNLRTRSGEERFGHEYWQPDGAAVCYVHYPDVSGRGATVRVLDIETAEERVLSRCTRFGWLTGNGDNSVIAGASLSLASPNIYVLFSGLRREMTVCEHLSSGRAYPVAGTEFVDAFASSPEPVFSPDSRWIYFVSDREGQPTVYRTDVSDLVENTSNG